MFVIIVRGKGYELPVLLSPEDYEWAMETAWFVTHGGRRDNRQPGYAARGSWLDGKRYGLIWMHKEVLLRTVGPPPTPTHHIGDHRNGNRLDNQRHNLRWATFQMNARNIHGFVEKQGDLFHHQHPENKPHV